MRMLAPPSCTADSIPVEVHCRQSYVLRLQHVQQALCHSGANVRSLSGVLEDVRNVIKARELPTIKIERVDPSPREQLHTLEARGADRFMHGV
ncbi:hypothetical protein PF005_g13158 [Phytophthora fragariae]|nr:hypothetical protein PF003_g10621 [Phytophthora fragariae]KAE9005477.1 hypothetical protein PF011_g12022 [Phytophthora fragariae]KAE9084797.1 hypothetical protein PF007_g21381 [Phytophthora fragariae]KAE9106257.1 hypothetical protein PF010_g12686 [Phytophthora fragariae]KAE9206050.1 hypothetical protein PF005_g13158 [Phytophthora fragariae]